MFLLIKFQTAFVLNVDTWVFIKSRDAGNSEHSTLKRVIMTYHDLRQGKGNERLSNVIDTVLNRVLGRQAAETFYAHLETTHAIQRQNIAHELSLFNSALREYFGAGADVIERAIHKNMELAELEAELNLLEKTRILKLA